MVIVPERELVAALGSQMTVTVPSLLPEAGVTDSQSSDSATVQEILEKIENAWLSPEGLRVSISGETLKEGVNPACVT